MSGEAPRRIAGNSCARTTWENATLTAAWLGQHHPGAPQRNRLALRETVGSLGVRMYYNG